MAMAVLSSYRSKDPQQPHGACIVDRNQRIIGIGYNGFPRGCSDDCLPWHRSSSSSTSSSNGGNPANSAVLPWLHTSAPYVVHAPQNAIWNRSVTDCQGARLYTPHFPCHECAKVIVQADIAEVVYASSAADNDEDDHPSPHADHNNNNSHDDDVMENEDDMSQRASRILLQLAGVRTRRYQPQRRDIHLNFFSALSETERSTALASLRQQDLVEAEKEEEQSKSNHGATATPLPEQLQYRDLLLREANYDPVTAPVIKRCGEGCSRGTIISWPFPF